MLILSRNAGQSIKIGHDIEVTILGINDYNQVKVGVSAPKSISVHREEIYQRIQRNEPQRKSA